MGKASGTHLGTASRVNYFLWCRRLACRPMHCPSSVPSCREHLSLFFLGPDIARILVVVGQAVFEIDQTLINGNGHNVQIVCQHAQPFVLANKLDVIFWDHFARSIEKRERRTETPFHQPPQRGTSEQRTAGVPSWRTGLRCFACSRTVTSRFAVLVEAGLTPTASRQIVTVNSTTFRSFRK